MKYSGQHPANNFGQLFKYKLFNLLIKVGGGGGS